MSFWNRLFKPKVEDYSIKELQDFIGQQRNKLTEFDEKLVKRWLRQITVWDDHYTVELKSGLSIDVPA